MQRDPGSTHHDLTRGLLMMILAMLVVPSGDVIAKVLSAHISGVQVAQARFGFQALIMLPIVVWFFGWRGLIPNRPWLCAARGLLAGTAVGCFFTALRWMPLPDAIAVFFIQPLVLTLLSAVFLGERVGWRRMGAVGAGFLGALIVIRPSYQVFGPVSLLPIAAAFFYAAYLILTSKLSKTENGLTLQWSSGLSACLGLTVFITIASQMDVEQFAWVWPDVNPWLLLALSGVIGACCQQMVVQAFKIAPASVLAPFGYLEIISATALSYAIFNQVPGAGKWVGITIIVGSGLFVFWRERRTYSPGPANV